MSDDRETPAGAGAPVEENEATNTELLAAVDRAADLTGADAAGADPSAADSVATAGSADPTPQTAPVVGESSAAAEPGSTAVIDPLPEAQPEERAAIALPDELPTAGETVAPVGLPPAAPASQEPIVISSDHPMAALYTQAPAEPELRGNRGAGIGIAIVATIAFAIVHTGVLALWLAPTTSPSQFVNALTNLALWPLIASSAAFFIGLVIVVLIVGRAGWWAYVLGGFLVAALVWLAAVAGSGYAVYQADGGTALTTLINDGAPGGLTPVALMNTFGLTLPAIAAAIVAREVVVWFGAWIGGRGRRITRKNAEALQEYEDSLLEAQTKLP